MNAFSNRKDSVKTKKTTTRSSTLFSQFPTENFIKKENLLGLIIDYQLQLNCNWMMDKLLVLYLPIKYAQITYIFISHDSRRSIDALNIISKVLNMYEMLTWRLDHIHLEKFS